MNRDESSRPTLGTSLVLAVVGGTLYFLAFPGFDVYPLAFVALVPLVVMLEREADSTWKRRAGLAFAYGLVEYFGGYSFISGFLETFSGFPLPVTLGITLLFCGYLALFTVAFALLYGRARARGASPTAVVVAVTCALESTFPMIFPSYLGNTLHQATFLVQLADLGGPLLLSAFVALVNGAIAETWLARAEGTPLPRRLLAAVGATFAAALSYGAYRTHEVDARAAAAPSLEVAMVQVNMGTFSKREDPLTGHLRHLEQSREVERRHVPDLFVWPESAFTFVAPRDVEMADVVVPGIAAPVLFGGLSVTRVDGVRRPLNTAFLVGADDRVLGRYDKHHLVPFGETIPFGETFPSLYALSPNTGNFARGTSFAPVVLGPARMSVFICYEDLLPGFVHELVQEGRPNLLVNLTNDAWYGDTHEPIIHLALAELRAVEHHRALVRSTNSGISAFVDPAGRVVARTSVFTRENLVRRVPLLEGGTLYGLLGPAPFALAAVLVTLALALRPVRQGNGPTEVGSAKT